MSGSATSPGSATRTASIFHCKRASEAMARNDTRGDRMMRLVVLLQALLVAGILATGLTGGHVRAADTLYQDLGERGTIVKFVDIATDKWLADDRIKDTF